MNIFPSADIFPAFDAKFRATLDRPPGPHRSACSRRTPTRRTRPVRSTSTRTSRSSGARRARTSRTSSWRRRPRRRTSSISSRRARRSRRSPRRSRPTRRAARRAARSAASRPASSCPRSRRRPRRAPFGTPIGPVHSQFGYHVILVTHATPTLRRRRARRCCTALRPAGSGCRAGRRSTRLLKAFKVHVDPRFGTWGLTPNGQGQPSTRSRRRSRRSRATSREGTTTTADHVATASPGADRTP